jgi:hypothetical protein
VPPIDENAKGNAYLQGAFDVGEGNYHVELLMRNRSERRDLENSEGASNFAQTT